VTLSEFETYSDVYPARERGVNAWIAVMRGCNNFCTFCVVPYTRGRERSRSVENIVEETRRLAADDFKQVTLLGQNVNSYYAEGKEFADLLEAVSGVAGIERVRLRQAYSKDPVSIPGGKTNANWLAPQWDESVSRNVEWSMDLLGRTIACARANGCRVLVTGVPHLPQYRGQWSTRPHGALADTARKHGVPYLNSFEALQRLCGTQPVARLYWAKDPTHLNREGQRLWAQAQLEVLLDRRHALLPEAAPSAAAPGEP